MDDMNIKYFTYIPEERKLIITWGGTNLIQENLNNEQEAFNWVKNNYSWMIEEFLKELDEYNRKVIEKHYPMQKQVGFFQALLQLQQSLANPNLTDEQKQAIQQKITKIEAVADWIKNKCTGLYYQLEAQIEQATTLDELNQIASTYQELYKQVEDEDPKLTFKDLL